jgi:hypothetical protein
MPPPGLLVALHVEPAVRHVVAGEEGLHLVRALRPPVAEDADLRRLGWVRVRPVVEEAVDHRVEPLLLRVPGLEHVVVEGDVVDRLDRDVGVGVRRQQQQLGVG